MGTQAILKMDGEVKSVTNGGRVKYQATTEDGVLVIAYLPDGVARESVRIGLIPQGRKVKVEKADGDGAGDAGEFASL